ncbi:MAG: acetyl-CoA carboxylase carboxyltransferase subunit alpha [Acidimicrobiales bacterium]
MTTMMSRARDGNSPAGPEVGWRACPGCGRLCYVPQLARDRFVCASCGHHFRLGARDRIATLVDGTSFTEIRADDAVVVRDPLGFTDVRPYADRLDEAVGNSGEDEAVVAGTAELAGCRLVIVAMDFRYLGGSMGVGVGERVTVAAEMALDHRLPLVIVCASGGARMQEGVLSLLQMAKTAQALARLHDEGVPSFCVLTDPTFGGVSASFAMLGGIVLAEQGALVGFAGPRVIAQTIREDTPDGFQTSEFLFGHGLVDRVVERGELRSLLGRLLALHGPNAPTMSEQPIVAEPTAAADAWDVVQTARDVDRPTALDYLNNSFDDFVELHGDRAHGDDPALVAAVARIGGRSVVVVGHQKGHDTRELVARNFGMAHPEGYRKARRMFEYAERHGFPVVTLVDTAGAFPGVEAERRGQSTAIAELIQRSSRLRVPVVSVVTGEGGSGGALAMATGDRLLMLEHSFYSVISPEGCAAILWHTSDRASDAARALRITAGDLLSLGVADGVVPEPEGGAQTDPATAAVNLRRAVVSALDDLDGVEPDALVEARYERFRRIGTSLTPERFVG